jgi:hypothetical protein
MPIRSPSIGRPLAALGGLRTLAAVARHALGVGDAPPGAVANAPSMFELAPVHELDCPARLCRRDTLLVALLPDFHEDLPDP